MISCTLKFRKIRFKKLFRFTQLVSGRGGFCTQGVCLQGPPTSHHLLGDRPYLGGSRKRKTLKLHLEPQSLKTKLT